MVSAQTGDQADYRLLLSEIAQVLERYFCSRIGAGAYVDDCVQELLLAVHEARHTYDPGRQFRPWLFAIARHKAIDRLRHQTRLREDRSVEGGARELAHHRGPPKSHVQARLATSCRQTPPVMR